jgi:hypothetical protein
MAKKLAKSIEGSVVTITSGEVTKSYDFSKLPAEIQTKFGPFGLGHKLGDSAAGVDTTDEIFKSIDKVWEGLMASNWSVKAPAGEKISLSVLTTLYNSLAGKDKTVAKGLLEKAGLQFNEDGSIKPKEVKAPATKEAKPPATK